MAHIWNVIHIIKDYLIFKNICMEDQYGLPFSLVIAQHISFIRTAVPWHTELSRKDKGNLDP